MCGLDNLNSVPDVIFYDLIVFLVVGAQGFGGRLVGDSCTTVLSIHFKTPTLSKATLQMQGSIKQT